ncbi:MAG: acetyltransferase [Fulvivirga sp.]|uniref:acetyltransferase n=1 Tax=Fulvivirga sp. TaxID=1931237 RepID=UPI0032EAC8EA
MYLIGASGHAKVVIDILEKCNVQVLGAFDDDPSKTSIMSIPVLGVTQESNGTSSPCIITIGNNKIRKNLSAKLNISYSKAVHPSAIISKGVEIELGTVIMASAVVNADTKIGRHVIVNTSASIDHDCVIGDYVHIAPNATLTGGVKVGEGAFIGAGAVILPGIMIGEWAIIGAGAVVKNNVLSNAKVVGIPAKEI